VHLLVGELEGAVEHLGLGPFDDAALAGLSHDQSHVLARAREHARRRGLDAEQARHPRCGNLQDPHERPADQRQERGRVGEHDGDRLRPLEGERLRHELAQRDAQVREDQERDRVSQRRRDPRVEVVGEERLADGAHGDRKDGDRNLDGADEDDRRVHQRQRAFRAATTSLRAFLQARTARCHERVFGGDEDRVAHDEQPDQR
jgi:hypothetical protein